jgi:hypothetical protein
MDDLWTMLGTGALSVWILSRDKPVIMAKPKSLPFHDQRHLEAAQGWFELGKHLEANEELENITAENRAHPAVLEVRWQIYANVKKWDAALDIVVIAPSFPASHRRVL